MRRLICNLTGVGASEVIVVNPGLIVAGAFAWLAAIVFERVIEIVGNPLIAKPRAIVTIDRDARAFDLSIWR